MPARTSSLLWQASLSVTIDSGAESISALILSVAVREPAEVGVHPEVVAVLCGEDHVGVPLLLADEERLMGHSHPSASWGDWWGCRYPPFVFFRLDSLTL